MHDPRQMKTNQRLKRLNNACLQRGVPTPPGSKRPAGSKRRNKEIRSAAAARGARRRCPIPFICEERRPGGSGPPSHTSGIRNSGIFWFLKIGIFGAAPSRGIGGASVLRPRISGGALQPQQPGGGTKRPARDCRRCACAEIGGTGEWAKSSALLSCGAAFCTVL